MHSIEFALAQDFFRRGRFAIPLVLLTMIAIPLWLFEALGRDGALNPEQREAVVLHVALTMVMGFGAAVAVFHAQGKLDRFFPRPISAVRLVGCQMALGMATIVAMYCLSTTILNLRDVGWPILGPCMFLATSLACALAAIWSFEGSVVGQLIACSVTSAPLVVWFSRCYGGTTMGDWQRMWRNPTAVEAVSLAGLTAAAFIVAVIGVARVRRGDRWDFSRLIAWWDERTARTGAAPATFRGPLAAQIWSEGREKARLLPAAMIGAFLVFAALLHVGGWINRRTLLEIMTAIPMIGLMFMTPLVFGLVLGGCGGREGKPEMKHFLAVRPVTDGGLATALLSNIALSLLWGWGVWLVGWLLVLVCVCPLSEWREVVISLSEVFKKHPEMWQVYLGFPILSWTLTALMSSLMATGNQRLIILVVGITIGTTLLFGVFKQIFTPPIFDWLVAALYVACGALCIGGTAWAHAAAVRRKLISRRVALVSAVWFLLAAILVYRTFPPRQVAEAFWLWHVIGLLALAVLPFAAMPLAVRWNRHR